MGKLDNGTWMHYNPIHFLEDKNSTVPLQKGGRGAGWLTAKETSFTNDSITLINIDKGNLTVIETTFDNDYIHILNYLPKRYMYG